MPKIQQSDIGYYYAGSQRIAMRDANGVYFLLSDHLGSSSVVIDESGQIVESGYYLPWGGQRGDEEITTTDYGYTGQMQEGDIYFYNSRWYDPAIGRFMQADSIVPPTQGIQGFDRYAYVNNNPLRYTDPSGHWYIEGWQDSYLIYQGDTNKCALYSLSMAVSVIYGTKVDEAKLDGGWLWTDNGVDWGVPPRLQPSGANDIFRNIDASYTTGGKEEIIKLLEENYPVVATFAFPLWGHSVLSIGYEPKTNELIFADPGTGTIRYENEFIESTRDSIYKVYPWTDPAKNRYAVKGSYDSINNFLRQTDIFGFVPQFSLTVVRPSTYYHGGGKGVMPPIVSPGGRGPFQELY